MGWPPHHKYFFYLHDLSPTLILLPFFHYLLFTSAFFKSLFVLFLHPYFVPCSLSVSYCSFSQYLLPSILQFLSFSGVSSFQSKVIPPCSCHVNISNNHIFSEPSCSLLPVASVVSISARVFSLYKQADTTQASLSLQLFLQLSVPHTGLS